MTAVLEGDWEKAKHWTRAMQSPNLLDSLAPDMEALGKAIADRVKHHISAQDMGWTPLSPRTVKRKGHTMVYLETTEYSESITSEITRSGAFSIDVTIFPKGIQSKTGLPISQIGKWLEYGTKTIPARPLWRPVALEVRSMPEFRDLSDMTSTIGFDSL